MSIARTSLRIVALAGVTISLIGCDSIREAAGIAMWKKDFLSRMAD